VAGFQARTDIFLRIPQAVRWEADALSVRLSPSFYGRRARTAPPTGLLSTCGTGSGVHAVPGRGGSTYGWWEGGPTRACTALPWCRRGNMGLFLSPMGPWALSWPRYAITGGGEEGTCLGLVMPEEGRKRGRTSLGHVMPEKGEEERRGPLLASL